MGEAKKVLKVGDLNGSSYLMVYHNIIEEEGRKVEKRHSGDVDIE